MKSNRGVFEFGIAAKRRKRKVSNVKGKIKQVQEICNKYTHQVYHL